MEMFSSWLPLSHSQRIVSFLMPLGVLLCLLSSAGTSDLGNEGHGTGAHVLPQELALSCWNPSGRMKQGDALAQGLMISPHHQSQKWCRVLAAVGDVLIGLSRETPTVGNETHHAPTKTCHLVDFQWFSPASVVGEEWRVILLLLPLYRTSESAGSSKGQQKGSPAPLYARMLPKGLEKLNNCRRGVCWENKHSSCENLWADWMLSLEFSNFFIKWLKMKTCRNVVGV